LCLELQPWLAPTATTAVAVTTGYLLADSALGLAFPGLLDRPMAAHHGKLDGLQRKSAD
jgi:hypothetical protein